MIDRASFISLSTWSGMLSSFESVKSLPVSFSKTRSITSMAFLFNKSVISHSPPMFLVSSFSSGIELTWTSPSSAWLGLAFSCAIIRQLTSGSYRKTSNIAIKLSLFCLKTVITCSQVFLKLPSMPEISIALTSILVSLNGTNSGHLSRFIATSKQSPKSI